MTDQTLASWNDGPAKRAIVDFVTSAATARPGVRRGGGPDRDVRQRRHVVGGAADAAAVRLRVPQVGAGDQGGPVARRASSRTRRSSRRTRRSSSGVATQDPEVVATLEKAFARSWAGTTPDEFDAQVRDWLQTVKQPKLGVPYVELVYKPMLELLEYLRAHEFRVFVCSGGGRDFMRVFAEETWGIYKENVIGTAAEYTYTDGKIVRAAGDPRRPRFGRGQARAHLRPDRPASVVRRRERRRRHRDARSREVRRARQPRRRRPRVRLHRGRGDVAGQGQAARLDGRRA